MRGADPGWAPGTVNLLQGETARLRELARTLDDLALDLRLLAPQGWEGRASEAYVEVRDALAKQCRFAAGAHELAARALDNYVQILAELAERRRYESAVDGLARLEQQRVDAADQLEKAWQEATEELWAVRAVLPEIAVTRPAVPVPAPRPAAPESPVPRASDPLDPRAADRAGYRRSLQELSDALLDHWPGA
ncbi:putative T7SS-secreted protein [Amycolatopsis sp. cmx-4-68]|uniref:putative T7SS-secreted protein n=1 Tax=Amycolatopsis sp. cmx-4-68 TaxID=2790938 RepID=UPI00397BFAEB